MKYSLKLAFWDRLLQAQCLQRYDSGACLGFANGDRSEAPTEQSFDLFPEMAREKFYQSGSFFCAGDTVASLNAAFQSLEICAFTLGNNHPALTIVMQHIATICESQGLRVEARRMREDAEELVAYEQCRWQNETPYLH